MNSPFAIYVHTPFCPSKCGYCDFNSYAMDGEIVPRTVDAIEAEIRSSPWAGRPAKTVFFGGGTPTFLEAGQLLRLLRAVRDVHPFEPGTEVTTEANPGTADAMKFMALRDGGFNRMSLGAQSFRNDDLLRLGRVHVAGEIEQAFAMARNAGFDNLNLDLMFALPGQSVAAWKENLNKAIGLHPEHLSLYCLTLEPHTAFYRQHLRGTLVLPEEEDQVAMYEVAITMARDAGYQQYEISNFAQPGRACAHNLCYWQGEEYAGYGPGAVGFVEGRRYTNLKHPTLYIDALEAGRPLAFEEERIDAMTHRTERIMLGLRLNDGVDATELSLPQQAIQLLTDRGWLESFGSRVRLTESGRHFCSEATLALIG